MSWFTDLAGKAESMLNILDQNAATVLQHRAESDGQEVVLEDVSVPEMTLTNSNVGLATMSGASLKPPLSFSQPLTPKKRILVDPEQQIQNILNETAALSQKQTTPDAVDGQSDELRSNISSRRSSISSRKGNVVIENETVQHFANPVANDSIVKELAATKIVLAEIKCERDSLKSEIDLLTDQIKNSKMLQQLKELEKMNVLLQNERSIILEKNTSAQEALQKATKSIGELELVVSKLHSSESSLAEQLDWAKRETEQAVGELQQYRTRAQANLQIKEKMIEELKLNSGINDQTETLATERFGLNTLEIEQLRVDKANLVDECRRLAEQLETTRQHVNAVEERSKGANAESDKSVERLRDELRIEKQRSQRIADQLKENTEEVAVTKSEISRQKGNYLTQLGEKEKELKDIRAQISRVKAREDSEFSVENRIQSLTQSLVQKQTSLEAVTADRNALKLQLEKIDSHHRSVLSQLNQERTKLENRSTIVQLRQNRSSMSLISVNDTDDAKAQLPNFMQENPFDTSVARRVKRVYSSLDAVGVHLGIFMRRYPLIRILVIFYVALLHLWVLVVLFSSTPS